ncbi:ATP-binding protein [Streptomyces alkaliterrae]|uniref:ATP-binding protein n=1 Tax=Streptomyces alkaliterrae TaxID=2213162 RepID=A0A5P0YSW6_9ACTN|nr:ATP-binding protein [Streptomyces alkaliterrae]MBB1260328.1 ATP-binding protein [Streptomyces alkaliterrae]MQS03414.1 ATP-binding protein [Streptomyces alkaliterrae]
MITHPASSRHCAVEFQALPSRIGQVRHIVSTQLRYWGLDPLIDAAALGVTELLANVHRHTGPDKHCTVELVLLWDRLTVSVRDHDPRLPRLRPKTSLGTSGRGLALVAALSSSWGARVQRGGSGKVVWFTLPAPPTAGAGPQAEAPPTAATAGAVGPDSEQLPA